MSSGAFPKQARLTRGVEFSRVFDRPVVVQDRNFRILARDNGMDHARLGLAVSKKVSRTAVGRNRLKRLARESFRRHRDLLAGQGGIDIVVLPARRSATICNRELTESLATLWRRLTEDGRWAAGKQG